MELKAFNESFNPLREKLAEIDGVVKESGQHFNEAQIERVGHLLDELDFLGREAVSNAAAALRVEPIPSVAGPVVDDSFPGYEVTELEEVGPDYVAQEGDILTVKDGKRVKVRLVKSNAPPKPPINAQADQLAGTDDPITHRAMMTLQAAADKAVSKRPPQGIPGIVTTATGAIVDKPHGDRIELATTEGDIQQHHTDDGSRIVDDKDEPRKLLTPHTIGDGGTNNPQSAALAELEQNAGGASHRFIPSITADQPADEAAVESGRQEIIPQQPSPTGSSGVIVDAVKEQPADAGNIHAHPTP